MDQVAAILGIWIIESGSVGFVFIYFQVDIALTNRFTTHMGVHILPLRFD